MTALAQPGVRERLAADGNEAIGLAPDAFAATIKSDIAKYASIVRSAKIKPD